jgi:hypothetical protein
LGMDESYKLHIDSRNRESGSTSSTDFVIKFLSGFPPVMQAELKFVRIPLALYTILSTNATIYFNENSTNKTAALTPGYYSGTQLAAHLKTVLDTASGGYNTFTVSYSTTTFKFTITAGNNFSLSWATGGPYLTFGYTASNTSAATTTTSTNAAALDMPLTLGISIAELNSVVYTGNSKMIGSLFEFPLDEGGSYVNTWEPKFPYIVKTPPRVFDRLTIRLIGMDGSVVNLNNADWCFSMDIHTSLYANSFNKKTKRVLDE